MAVSIHFQYFHDDRLYLLEKSFNENINRIASASNVNKSSELNYKINLQPTTIDD